VADKDVPLRLSTGTIGKIALRAVVIAAVAVGLYLFVRDLDGHALLVALRDAALAPVVLAALVCFGNMFMKSLAWRVLLGSAHRVPVVRIFRYTLAAFAGSLLVPARAGEALRLYLLKRHDGVPVTTAASVALAEKLLDGSALVLVVAQLLWIRPGLPSWVGRSIALLVLFSAAGVVALIVVRRVAHPQGFVGRLAAGMMVLSRPRTTALALGAYVVGQLGDVTAVLLVLGAVGIHVGLGGALLVHLAVNVAIMVPSTPGNLGSLEIGALAALQLLGVPPAAAMAFALLYHAMQAVPLLVVGLADARLSLGARPAT
jgi:uncharacterized membrane protein YbhN (UPF0104 family)